MSTGTETTESDRALAAAQAALLAAPDDEHSWVRRGAVRLARGELDQAVEDFSHALTIEPAALDALVNRAVALGRLGRVDNAMRDLALALDIDPANVAALKNRAHLRSLADDLDGAIADAKAAANLDDADADTHYNLGVIHRKLGQLDDAERAFSEALDRNPDDGITWASRGFVKNQKGDLAGAVADLDRAIALNSTDGKATGQRGVIHAALGERELAIADLNHAAELFEAQGQIDFSQTAIVRAEALQHAPVASSADAELAHLDQVLASSTANELLAIAAGSAFATVQLRASLAAHLRGAESAAVLPRLALLAHATDVNVRREAVAALGSFPDDGAPDILFEALLDPDPLVSVCALDSLLRQIGIDPKTLSDLTWLGALRVAVASPLPSIRAWAQGRVGDLLSRLGDSDEAALRGITVEVAADKEPFRSLLTAMSNADAVLDIEALRSLPEPQRTWAQAILASRKHRDLRAANAFTALIALTER